MKNTKEQRIAAEAKERAERAKRYAVRFPQFIRKADKIFQTEEWQFGMLSRFEEKCAPAKT